MESVNDNGKIHEALCKFHSLFEGIKGEKKEAFKGQYFELPTLISEIKPILNKCDLYFTQRVILINEHSYLQTTIRHKDGSFISDDGVRLYESEKAGDSKLQSIGSSISYARRYGLMSILGLAEYNDHDLDNPLKEKPKGNGGHSYRVEPLKDIDESQFTKFKEKYPDDYKQLMACKGGAGGKLRKVFSPIYKKLKDEDSDVLKQVLKLKDELKPTTNE